MLYMLGKKNYNLRRVRNETHTEVIGKWLKFAIKVNSIAEFENELLSKKEED